MGVRVPRITLNADFGDDAAFGDLSLLSVGYGLHQAWVFATMFGTTSIFGTQTFVSGLYDSQVSLVYMISIAAYVACLFIVAATNQRFLERYTSKKFISAGALFATAGTLVLLAPLAEHVILEVVAGVLTGVGSSILILAWGTAFARSDSASIILNTGIAISISIIIYALGLLILPYPLTGWITAAIPFLNWQYCGKRRHSRSMSAANFRILNRCRSITLVSSCASQCRFLYLALRLACCVKRPFNTYFPPPEPPNNYFCCLLPVVQRY